MRTPKELYTIIAEEYSKRKTYGICVAIAQAYHDDIITKDEMKFLRKDMRQYYPTPRSIAFYHPAFRQLIATKDGYWWTNNKRGDRQRDKFLQKIIKKLK